VIAHWDDVEPEHVDNGVLGLDGYDLGEAAGSEGVGVTRARVLTGRQSSPLHVELDEEEIFYVLDGSGTLVLRGAELTAHEVRAGDCIVHRVAEEAHVLVGGPAGLDVLAFGERTDPGATWLPRPRIVRMGVSFHVPTIDDPWELEAAHGPVEPPPLSPRPSTVRNLDEVESEEGWTPLARRAGSVRTALNHIVVPPNQLHAPPHCHTEDEELFVVLEGEGVLELTPSPGRADTGSELERHPVREGHVVSRPPSTGLAHGFRAGDGGLTLLGYGTRRRNDICYYPRSNKISFRGLGLIARLDHVRYEVGEESVT